MIKTGQRIRFDTYENVKEKLIEKNGDGLARRFMNDEDNVYGISESLYKSHFENKTFEITGIRDSDETFYVGVVEGYNFVFDEAFIKKNMIDIDDSLFKL